jgi:hypothetical protein
MINEMRTIQYFWINRCDSENIKAVRIINGMWIFLALIALIHVDAGWPVVGIMFFVQPVQEVDRPAS